MSGVFRKINLGISWRRENFRRHLFRLLSWWSPWLLIWLRWPWPLHKPWQRRRLRVRSKGGGIGDELMCSAVLREIKRRNPSCHITFFTRRPDFFRHLPYLDAVEAAEAEKSSSAWCLGYGHGRKVPRERPIISLMGECAGLVMRTTQIDPPRVDVSKEFGARIAAIPSPRIVVQPRASEWTPNKNWPLDYWLQLVKLLTEKFSVIEVGMERTLPAGKLGPRFHSFAGQTSLSELACVISQAAAFVGPVSGGMHLANAFEIPSVIIIGGYESPNGHQYPRSTVFYSPVPCAPCWLATKCPHELKCLKLIEPALVFEAVCRAVKGGQEFQIISSKIPVT